MLLQSEKHGTQHVVTEQCRGSQESRAYYVFTAPASLKSHEKWPSVGSVGTVVYKRIEADGKEHLQERYFVSSLSPQVKLLPDYAGPRSTF